MTVRDASFSCNHLRMGLEWGKQNSINNQWVWLGHNSWILGANYRKLYEISNHNSSPHGFLTKLSWQSEMLHPDAIIFVWVKMRQTKLHQQSLGLVGSQQQDLSADDGWFYENSNSTSTYGFLTSLMTVRDASSSCNHLCMGLDEANKTSSAINGSGWVLR